jgi:hypothetical protein
MEHAQYETLTKEELVEKAKTYIKPDMVAFPLALAKEIFRRTAGTNDLGEDIDPFLLGIACSRIITAAEGRGDYSWMFMFLDGFGHRLTADE